MGDASQTSSVLLHGLFDLTDAAAWEEFDRRYRPIVVGFARRAGLSDTDAADVAQETMAQFVRAYVAGEYDRARGRLRTWLIALTKSKVAQAYRARARRGGMRGDSGLIDLADKAGLEALWEAERRRHLLRLALASLGGNSRLHPRTIRAFELLVLRAIPVAAVAEQLAMSPHDVYLAKGRVARRLQELLADLETRFDDAEISGGHPGDRA